MRLTLSSLELDLVESSCFCGSNSKEYLPYPERHDIAELCYYKCLNCGSVFSGLYPSEASLDNFYRKFYHSVYGRVGQAKERSIRRKQEERGTQISSFLGHNHLDNISYFLEVGSSYGVTSSTFAHYCPNLSSFDTCEVSGEIGTSYKPATKIYDLVFSNHVLEHINDPINALKDYASKVSSSGIILTIVPQCFTTHDHYLKPLALLGKRLPFLYKSVKHRQLHLAHKYCFSAKGLQFIAEQLNLKLLLVNMQYPNSQPELWAVWSKHNLNSCDLNFPTHCYPCSSPEYDFSHCRKIYFLL